MPFSSRFQNYLEDRHRETPLAGRYDVMAVLIAALVFAAFLADAAAQGSSIANMAKQRVNAKVAQQQPQSSAPDPQQQPVVVQTRRVMPDLVSRGLTFENAEIELRKLDAPVDDRRDEYSSDVEAARLIAQYPRAGTPLTPDPDILLIVSKGPDPSLSTADLSVEVTLQTKEPYSEGQAVQYNIVVNNLGRVMAKDVRIIAAPKNLRIDRSSAPCSDLSTCIIPSIPPNRPVTINVTATVLQAGDFDNIVTVKGSETDPDPANNIDFAGNGGTAPIRTNDPGSNSTSDPTPKEPFPWEWIILGTAGGLLTGGILTKAVWPSTKPNPDLIRRTPRGPTNDIHAGPPAPSIDTYVDLETGPSYCDPFPISGPPLSLTVDLELGQMSVDENIQVLKEEVVYE